MNEVGSISAHAIGMSTFCPRLAVLLDRRSLTIPSSNTAKEEKDAVVRFARTWSRSISHLGSVNLGRLDYILSEAEGSILGTTTDENSRKRLAGTIRNMKNQINALAGSCATNGHISTEDLFNSYFGGRPEFDQTVDSLGIKASVDIVANRGGASRVWMFVPSDGLGLDSNARLKDAFIWEGAAEAAAWEKASCSQCTATVVFDGVPRIVRQGPKMEERIEKAKRMIREGRSDGFSSEKCVACQFHSNICAEGLQAIRDHPVPSTSSTENGEGVVSAMNNRPVSDSRPVGRIVQNFSKQLAIQVEKKRLFGYLFEEKAETVHAGDILVAVSTHQSSSRLLCRVVEAKSANLCASIPTKSVEGFVCNLTLEPVGVTNGQRLEEVPNANYDSYELHWPSTEDLGVLYSLPPNGIPLGFIATPVSKYTIPYLYDPRQAFKSFFVCGGQGTGKTNFLRYFVRAYREHLKPGPAIVILDVEGQFIGLESSLVAEDVGRKVNILKVASSDEPGDVTLSFRAVGEKYLSHFVPELPTRTTEMLERITHEVFVDLAARGENAIVQRVLREIGAKATRDGRLHFTQRDAIQRAAVSPTFNIFDQPDVKPLSSDDLLIPGKTTVIDASEMSEDDQRVVAIYLMAILFEAKMKNHNEGDTNADVLLVVDEAHRLFPRHHGLKRDYVMRVAKFVEEVTHRGRKRNYGILLATQSPADISQGIVGLCETKLFFRVAGHQIWLKEHVGNKEVASSIGNLQNFQAYVIVKGSSREPVAIGFPNVSDQQPETTPVEASQIVEEGADNAS